MDYDRVREVFVRIANAKDNREAVNILLEASGIDIPGWGEDETWDDFRTRAYPVVAATNEARRAARELPESEA